MRGDQLVRRTRGLTHRFKDGFNIIVQYNTFASMHYFQFPFDLGS